MGAGSAVCPDPTVAPPPPGQRYAPDGYVFPAFEFGVDSPIYDGSRYPFDYRYGYEFDFGARTLAEPAGFVPPRSIEPFPVLANEFLATLTLQFPAAAEVWVNGKKADGAAGEERVLKSPVLTAGEQYTFDVRARWRTKDKTYETKRALSVGSGERSRVLVVSGEEVK